MADPDDSPAETRQGRPRAPTIQIDTSAVGPPDAPDDHIPLQSISNATVSKQGESRNAPPPTQILSSPPATSPSNFLSVPGGKRPRADSFDSEGDTYTGTPSASSEGDRRYSGHGDSHTDLLNDEDPLKPDPGTEEDFQVEGNKFAFTPGHLSKLLNPKTLPAFQALGGLAGIEKGLRTDAKAGLSVDEKFLDGKVSFEDVVTPINSAPNSKTPSPADQHDPQPEHHLGVHLGHHDEQNPAFADRLHTFNDNRLPERKTKSLFQLMWMAYNDKVLILLSIAAAISLAVGIYQSVRDAQDPNGEAPVEWVEGVAIIVAIVIVVIVGALNDWQKEKQFVKLNKKKDERFIKVVRSGRVQEISVWDVLVGDVVLMEAGDMIPVDGIFIEGHNVKCDEASATGESDLLRKTPGFDVYQALEENKPMKKMDPFILSGSKVTEGVGRFLVTATGVNSTYGKTMLSLRDEGEVTPLQSKLNVLAEYIAKAGLGSALLYFVVVFIEFLVHITSGSKRNLSGPDKGQLFLEIFVTAVSVVVVAVPEGLPLAVTLALAFATTRMLKDNNLVRLLRSCETMGNATTVCSDKTGTLTQNKMTVVAGTVGTASRFGDLAGLDVDPTQEQQVPNKPKVRTTTDVGPAEFVSTLHKDVKSLLEQSIVINSTAFEGEEDGKPAFVGSKTETAMLHLARDHLGMDSIAVERANVEVTQMIPFDSGRKCMAAVVKLSDKKYRMYVKGASEILLATCSHIIEDPTKGISAVPITSENTSMLNAIISTYASKSLRTIALLYRDFENWPPRGARKQEDDRTQVMFEDLLKEMTFLGVVGIQDPLRPGVSEAVADCKRAGVVVRMVTGDNVQTAKAIAASCGIYTNGEVMEGPAFRKLSSEELTKVLPRLQVLARSSPEDKRKLVKKLKELGETVAVTGDGTNDAPALKTADVGFSMGIAGTEVAKEASAIILMDDNFSSIVKALMWGRAVNDAVKKFLQFQLTVNIGAVLLTFITGVASVDSEPALTPVQLLWVNLIMDTFAALALATDPPPPSIIDRMPDRKSAPLISVTMWKMIIGQAIYQLTVTLVLHFAGGSIFNYERGSVARDHQLPTIVFNTFVWMQIFNAFNNRRLDNRFNIFEGITRNLFFIGIIGIMIGAQVLIVFKGGAALRTHSLDGKQWAYCLVIGFLTIPIGMAIRCVPDELLAALVPESWKRKTNPKLVIEDEEQMHQYQDPLLAIRDELVFLKKFKGGRLNNLVYKIQHPVQSGMIPPRSSSGTRSRSSTNASLPQTPTPLNENLDRPLSPPPPSTPNRSPAPGSRSNSRRGRSRSGSAFSPAIAAAGIMAGSIAGWSPVERNSAEGFPISPVSRARSRSDLGNQVLTETDAETKAVEESGHKKTSST